MRVERITVLLVGSIIGLAGVVGLVHYSHYVYGPGGAGWSALHFVVDDGMIPTLNPRDAVVVQPIGLADVVASYGTSDVICFRSLDDPDRVIISRAVEEGAGELRTKGDNHLALDPWVVTEDVLIGKVVDVNPLMWRIVTVHWLSIGVTGALAVLVVILGARVLTASKSRSRALRGTRHLHHHPHRRRLLRTAPRNGSLQLPSTHEPRRR